MNCNKCGKEIANIQTASCTNFVCKKCGSTEYEIKDKSNGTGIAHGLYCAKCGFWHKWLGKEELKQYATKESKDEIIAKLQSENAALRERLEKAVELPYEVGSTVYIIHETDEEDKINPWIDAGRVVSFSIDVNLWIYVRYNSGLTMWYTKDSFDKEVYTTLEAAEAWMKELGGRR